MAFDSVFAGLPSGYQPFALCKLLKNTPTQPVFHICANDARLQTLAEACQFFMPEMRIQRLPAWDCLPYDRVSPHSDIVRERLHTLAELAKPQKTEQPTLILTTANAILQKLPPVSFFHENSVFVTVGDTISVEKLRGILANQGYLYVSTVREVGEFAVRGGIVDLFPASVTAPVRLDFFGDTIESIRLFDAVSQRTIGTLQALSLPPVREIVLDEASINRFRQGYRGLAGANLQEDALYTAITAKQPTIGMEHWLPLFHDELTTSAAYLPQNTQVSCDVGVMEALNNRYQQVEEYYAARINAPKGGKAYYPVAVAELFITPTDLQALLASQIVPPSAATATGLPSLITARQQAGNALYEAVRDIAREQFSAKKTVTLVCYSASSKKRLLQQLQQVGVAAIVEVENWHEASTRKGKVITVVEGLLEQGFNDAQHCLFTEQDIWGDKITRRRQNNRQAEAFLQEVSSLSLGDYVVHLEHGIGQYDGLETVTVSGIAHDCVRLLYHGGDKLFVPVENLEVLSRYASEDSVAVLDKLGGVAWQARKAKVKERIKAIADSLLKIAAERQLKQGDAISLESGVYDEFCARFPYPETEDQLHAIQDVLDDMASSRPMDRLICGDVGFGKTEVALRAAFAAVLQGWKVAIVVPTTLLARQHYNNFVQRFRDFPVRIGQLSRLVSAKQATQNKQDIADGKLDIVIGTHAIFGKNVTFKKLGLVIVDEEQHFGVAQKEKLKEMKANVHLLTLSATPIPRTLQMALNGVREMSLIATPPVDRLAVRTFVLPFDSVVIREAIMREYHRNGQIFYVCPRLKDLPELEEKLRALVPEVKIIKAHGKMSPTELEEVMEAFIAGSFTILLSTQIVESGLDIPAANTIIIHNAHMFGLAQLYQLRGRVGRGKSRGYAYLTLPEHRLSKTAVKRLEVMQTLDHLGAGFSLASHDMDIRGAGNLLGDEQSGHIREVGVELYQQMLREAVATARLAQNQTETLAVTAENDWSPALQLGLSVLIPETYVADLDIRLALYRRAANLLDEQDIVAFKEELQDRFGALPQEVENLLTTIALKRRCLALNIEKIDAGMKGIVITFHHNTFAKPEALLRYIAKQAGTVKIKPDQKLVFLKVANKPKDVLENVRIVLKQLEIL